MNVMYEHVIYKPFVGKREKGVKVSQIEQFMVAMPRFTMKNTQKLEPNSSPHFHMRFYDTRF